MFSTMRSWLAPCVALLAAGCTGDPPSSPPPTDPACQLDTQGEKTPGYPFDVGRFTTGVLPIVSTSCSAGGCHAPPAGNAGFTVWASAPAGSCEFGKTFNNTIRQLDLTTPSNSRLLSAVTGGVPGHPFAFPAGAPQLATLQDFVQSAAQTFAAGGGGGVTPPPGPSPFNYTTFPSTIAPMFDRCATSGCHGTGAGTMTLKAAATAGADLQANFAAITSRADLTDPAKSLIYTQATTLHGGGKSVQIDATQAQQLLAWIQDAKGNAGTNPNPTCAPVSKFNAGVFATDVMPILTGQLDLNTSGGVGRGAGCMSAVCHGTDRGPGKLSLLATADTATQLQNFACFVDLASPLTSDILACPLNLPSCRHSPHPGQEVFGGSTDLNYQRVVGFVLGANAGGSPFDLAFFARRVNPIFNDVNAVEQGAQGRSCADTVSCHGVAVAGQRPPNGSNFPILPNASDRARLTVNFASATGFVNFLNPGESSLVLYPTNGIADRNAHPFATGLPHPGGADFAADSPEAQAILQWAAGLRPDAGGFQRNWLVAGDFPATRIADPTLVDETRVTPAIFDTAGGAFNRGAWDGLFSDRADVDLSAAFPRAATSGRVAYAVAYALNTTPQPLVAQLSVSTQNPIRIYLDGVLAAQNDQNGGASAVVNLPAAGKGGKPVRILIKLLQRSSDASFAFTAQLRDELGTLLTDATGELVFTLGPHGGF
jgi:hypothetical protein